jgi:hypothetical protein
MVGCITLAMGDYIDIYKPRMNNRAFAKLRSVGCKINKRGELPFQKFPS